MSPILRAPKIQTEPVANKLAHKFGELSNALLSFTFILDGILRYNLILNCEDEEFEFKMFANVFFPILHTAEIVSHFLELKVKLCFGKILCRAESAFSNSSKERQPVTLTNLPADIKVNTKLLRRIM